MSWAALADVTWVYVLSTNILIAAREEMRVRMAVARVTAQWRLVETTKSDDPAGGAA